MKKFQYQHYFRKRNNFSVLPKHLHDKQHNKQYSILHSNPPLYLSEKYLTNHQKIVLAKDYIKQMKRKIINRNNSIQKINNQILKIQRCKTLDSYCDNCKELNKDKKKYKKNNFQQVSILLEQQQQFQIRKINKNYNTIDHCIENNIEQQYQHQLKQRYKQMPTQRKQNSLILSKLKKYLEHKKQADQASGIVVSIIQNQRQSSKSGSNLCMPPAVNIKKSKVKKIQILQVNNVLKCKSLQKSRIIDIQIPFPIQNIDIEQQPRHQTQMLPIFKRYKGKYQTKTTKLTHLDRIKLPQLNQQQDHDQTLNFIIKSSSLQKKMKLNSLEQPINMWPFKKQKADFQKQFIQF